MKKVVIYFYRDKEKWKLVMKERKTEKNGFAFDRKWKKWICERRKKCQRSPIHSYCNSLSYSSLPPPPFLVSSVLFCVLFLFSIFCLFVSFNLSARAFPLVYRRCNERESNGNLAWLNVFSFVSRSIPLSFVFYTSPVSSLLCPPFWIFTLAISFLFVAGTRPISHRVGRSVGLSHFACPSHLAFFAFLGILRVEKFAFEHAPAQIITASTHIITAPAQPPATGAVVYTSLLTSFFCVCSPSLRVASLL